MKPGAKKPTRRGAGEGATDSRRKETQDTRFDSEKAGIGPRGEKVFGGI